MTIESTLGIAISALVLSSFWMLLVLVVRRPVSRWLGARWAYYLWLVPLVGLLAIVSPAGSIKQQFGFPGIEIPGMNFVISEAVLSLGNLDAEKAKTSAEAVAGSSL